MSIEFTVYGKPAQMGSKKAFVRGNRAIITDDNSKQRKQWANAVATAAAEAMDGKPLMDGPVSLLVIFFFARPKSHYGSGKNAKTLKSSAPERHAQSPDLDKLVRCLNDALTGIVFRDDRQVWHITAGRCWCENQEQAQVTVRESDA
jgi:Holliday junction resolvase RusA-like endonuclease